MTKNQKRLARRIPASKAAVRQSNWCQRKLWRATTHPLPAFGGFPAEAGERGKAAEEADGYRHAHVGGNQHAIQSDLPDESE